ncbi:MAG TPA: ATP synthase F1 subunit gamma [Chitinophagales bacterium]|nr:ATP synthase F1 subunit gamma [Chitinophagales bacterium]
MPGGKLKEVRTRIQSVISTQQITKAMKMVSAAKLRRAQDAIIQMRPYSGKLTEMLHNILSGSEGDIEIGYAKKREVKNVLLVLITSDKGLCGAFNSSLIKMARSLVQEKYRDLAKQGKVEIMTIGNKGFAYFKREPYPINKDFIHLFSHLDFDNVSKAAGYAMEGFLSGKFDQVEFVYSRFKNAATQLFTHEQFLPIPRIETNADGKNKRIPDFIYEPEKKQIIEYLVPKILKTQFYKAILDNNASEHGARMTAMDKASDNANELLRELRISYNRARQAAITTELTEIVSGAAALEG